MELKAKTDLERHLTKGKFYRVIDRTDKEFTIINDSKVKYSYPRKAFETTAESQTKIVNESIPHTTVSWTHNGASISSNNSGEYFGCMNVSKGVDLQESLKEMKTLRLKDVSFDPDEDKKVGPVDDSINNGGSTDYYKINPSWKDLQDIIEERKMLYSQANILKVAFTFNVGRHEGTDELREINKVIYFAERRKAEILKGRNND